MSSAQKTRISTFTTRSGEELTIVPVPMVDLAPLVRRLETDRPKPPVIRLADSTEKADESHPGYKSALARYDTSQGVTIMAIMIEFGVNIVLDDEQEQTVKRLQAKREKINPGAPENQYEIYTYVSTVCPDMEELGRLIEAITALSVSTAENPTV